jgi:hypothetical protein
VEQPLTYMRLKVSMTRKEYDQLPRDSKAACPDCGEQSTHPYPRCGCPWRKTKEGMVFRKHINKWHHTCRQTEEAPLTSLYSLNSR